MALSYKNDDKVDDRLNPETLRGAEQKAGEQGSHDSISGYDRKNDGLDDHPINGDSRKNLEEKESSGSFYNPDTNQMENVRTVSLKTILKKRGPLAAIGVILLGGGGIMTMLLSPALLIVQMSESMTDRFNDQLASMDLRSTHLLKKKLQGKTLSAGCGVRINVGCRYQTMSDRQLEKLAAAGITVPENEVKNKILNRTKPTTFIFEGKPIKASELLKVARSDPGLRSAIKKGYNPKFAGFTDSVARKTLSKLGIVKSSNIKPSKDKQKMMDDLQKTAAGDVEGVPNKKLTPLNDKGEVVPESEATKYVDDVGNEYADGQRINNLIDENASRAGLADNLTKDTVKIGVKGALTSAGFGAGAVDTACTGWVVVRVAGFAAKIYQQRQLVRYAYEFNKTASMLKAGDLQPEQMELMGDILTEPNSQGKNAGDSNGYHYAAYGTPFKAGEYSVKDASTYNNENSDSAADKVLVQEETTRYVNGQSLSSNAMGSLTKFIQMSKGGGAATVAGADKTCSFVKSWKGQAIVIGTAVAGLIAAGLTGGGSLSIGVVVGGAASVAVSVAFALLQPKLLAMAKGEVINGKENGNEAGNAWASGSGGFNAESASGGGNRVQKIDDAVEYASLTNQVAAEYAELDRYEKSPLDPSSPNTFVGSIVANILPYTSKTYSGGAIMASLPGFLGSALSFTPKASALNVNKDQYNKCTDPEYETLAADPFCNLRYGMSAKNLDIDADTVVDYMDRHEGSEEVYYEADEEGKVTPKGDYADYIALCFDRKNSIGDNYTDYITGEDGGSNKSKGDECIEGNGGANEQKYVMFSLFYIDTRVQDGMDDEPPVDTGTTASSGDGSQFHIATYNVKGASHDGDKNQYKGRMEKAMKIMENNPLDVIGAQEFEGKQRAYLLNSPNNQFAIYPDAQVNKKGYVPNPILWNKTKFKLVEGGMMPNLKYFNNSTLRAPWVILQDIATEQQFYVLNTHDPANPKNKDHSKVRYTNALQHVAFINSIKDKGLPIFYTGDFNSGYSLRDSGNTTYQDKNENLTYCIMTKDGFMKSAFDLSEKRQVKCPNPGDFNAVDHIYMSGQVELLSYKRIAESASDHDVHVAEVKIPGSGRTSKGWQWPIKSEESKPGPCFGGSRGHAGMDINSNSNSDVVALYNGKVVQSKFDSAAGNYVMILADDGTYYAYQHLLTGSVKVSVGQKVNSGEKIAKMGTTGNVNLGSSSAHLHLTMSKLPTLGSYGNTGNMFDPMQKLKSVKPSNYDCTK